MSRAAKIYLFSSFFQGALNWMVFIVAQLYRVLNVGLDPFALVLVGTTLEVSSFIFEIPTGVVADVFSRKLSVVIGFVIMGLGFMIEGIAPLAVLVFLAQVVWGLGWTFVSGANSAWITDEIGVEAAAPLFIRGNQVYQIGVMAGGTAGVLLGLSGLNLPFLAAGVFYILLGIVLAFLMPETGFSRQKADERKTWAQAREILQTGFHMIKSRKVLFWFFAALLFVGLYSEGLDRLWEPFFLQEISFPVLSELKLPVLIWFGLIQAGSIWLIIIGGEIARRKILQDQDSIIRVLPRLHGIIVISIVLLSGTKSFWIAVPVFWLISVLRSIVYPLNTTWINHQVEARNRATMLSFSSQVDALGQMTGGPILGGVGSALGLRWALRGSALLLLPAVGILRNLKRSTDD